MSGAKLKSEVEGDVELCTVRGNAAYGASGMRTRLFDSWPRSMSDGGFPKALRGTRMTDQSKVTLAMKMPLDTGSRVTVLMMLCAR